MSGMSEIARVLASAVVALYGERLGEDETVETVTASLLVSRHALNWIVVSLAKLSKALGTICLTQMS